jgi:radical SAM protein with 4Fe4S-binding SPASM domain
VTQLPELLIDAGARVLVVMARPLVTGAVKTRLAATIGADAALELYARLLGGTLDQAESLDDVTLVLAESDPDAAVTATGAPETPQTPRDDALAGRARDWRRMAQRGETLGERLATVFGDAFAAGAGVIVALDSDSPRIPPEYLGRAFAELGAAGTVVGDPLADDDPAARSKTHARVVAGPAADGGYYLIGTDRATWEGHGDDIRGLLTSSPMSTASLLAYTQRAARAQGIALIQLPLWVDVDRPEDAGPLDRLDGSATRRGEPLETLREIYLHLTHRCGRTCRHCYDRDAAWDPDELSTAEWKGAIDHCVALGASSFVFIGGDPLLRDDFTTLVDHITGRHEAKVRFFFNSLVDETAASELARVGRGLLKPLVSIDGPREINDELRGEGCWDDVMTSIANLLRVGLEPVANTVLVRPVLPGLAQLARELRAAGLSRLHLILPHQAGGVAPPAPGRIGHGDPATAPDVGLDLVPSGNELLAAVRDLLRVTGEIGLMVDNVPSWRRRLGRRNDLCAAGCKDLAIDPYGTVHACVITAGDPAFAAGSLREQPLEEIWRGSASLRLLRASRARDRAECLVCPVVDACGGECWVQAHYAARAHGRPAGYAAPFPYCDLVRPMLEELAAETGRAAETAGAAAPVAGTADAFAGAACGAACDAGGGQASAGDADYSLFDCI